MGRISYRYILYKVSASTNLHNCYAYQSYWISSKYPIVHLTALIYMYTNYGMNLCVCWEDHIAGDKSYVLHSMSQKFISHLYVVPTYLCTLHMLILVCSTGSDIPCRMLGLRSLPTKLHIEKKIGYLVTDIHKIP